MSNVIHVEFGKKNVVQEVFGNDSDLTAYPNSLDEIFVNEDSCLFEYLDMLRRQGVDDDDILDVADAINSYDVYMAADEVVQQLADGWLHQFL